jgi:hypothetical protein
MHEQGIAGEKHNFSAYQVCTGPGGEIQISHLRSKAAIEALLWKMKLQGSHKMY